MILIADTQNGVQYINKSIYKDLIRWVHAAYIYIKPEDFYDSLKYDVPVYTDIIDLKEIKRIYKDYNITK